MHTEYIQYCTCDSCCCPGTFGQPHKWNIHDSSTFEHPMIPHDVLMDPSIPGCKTESSSPPPPDTVTVEVEENVANEQEQDMLVDEVRCELPLIVNAIHMMSLLFELLCQEPHTHCSIQARAQLASSASSIHIRYCTKVFMLRLRRKDIWFLSLPHK